MSTTQKPALVSVICVLVLLHCCCAHSKAQKLRSFKNSRVKQISLNESPDAALAALCKMNAAKGDKADPEITEMCKNVEPSKTDCKPLPPHADPVDDHNIPLPDRLALGYRQMQDGLNAGIKCVFILGNTNSGKTTLTQILTGNLSRIYATQSANDMVIFDNDNHIGVPTFIPKFVPNPTTQTGFWDCPGFNESVTPDMDISTTYYLKTIMDSCFQAKFLFTLSALSIYGNEATDFDNLIMRATQLFQSWDNVNTSIGLVVTKVPNIVSGQYQTDEMIRQTIFKFLSTYVQNTTVSDKKRKLVKIFLNDSTNTSKVAFVRVPLDCGPLSKILSILDSKKMVEKLLDEKLIYSPVFPSYFAATLKPATIDYLSQSVIPQSVVKLGEKLEFAVRNLWDRFRQTFYYRLKNGQYGAPSQTLLPIRTDLETVFNQISSEPISSVVEKLRSVYRVFSAFVSDKDQCSLSAVDEIQHQLNFYELVTGSKIQIPEKKLAKPLKFLSSNFETLFLFYDFVDALELNIYNRQILLSNVMKSNPEKANFKANETLQFLSDNQIVRIPGHIGLLWQQKIDLKDKQYLEKLVKGLLPNTTFTCFPSSQYLNKSHLQVSGRNLKLSDFVNQRKLWPYPCSEPDAIKEISILASDTLYLDADIDANCKTLFLSMLAPFVEVIGSDRNIFLGCKQQEYIVDAAPGNFYGAPGQNGTDGKPGKNGGSFFGVFSKFKNFDNLKINADGGDGGQGQNGGQGDQGKPGEAAVVQDLPEGKRYIVWMDSSRLTQIGACPSYFEEETFHTPLKPVIYYKKFCTFVLSGIEVGQGGNGGNGGNGGASGNPGTVLLVGFRINTNITNANVSTKVGNFGKPGKGGIPGRGGIVGADLVCPIYKYVNSDDDGSWHWQKEKCQTIQRHQQFWALTGNFGLDGKSSPIPVHSEIPTELWKVVYAYKNLFSELQPKLSFIKDLDQNPNITELWTAKAFAEEIRYTEETYYNSDVNLKKKYVTYYQTFLARMKNYAQSANSSQLTQENKVALNCVYSAVLGKVTSMRQNGNVLKIINTEKYFDAISNEWDESKVINMNTAQREQAIAEESARYQKSLNSKISEAENFVQTVAQPAIAKSEDLLEKTNDHMIQEVNAYLQATEENLEKQRQLKKDFEATLPWRHLLGVLKFVGTAIQFLGIPGKIVGTAIYGTSAVAESLLLKPPSQTTPETFELPPAFGEQLEQQKRNWLGEKFDRIEKQLNMTQRAILSCKTGMEELQQKAEQTKKALDEIKGQCSDSKIIENIFDKLKSLDKLSTELEELVKKMAKDSATSFFLKSSNSQKYSEGNETEEKRKKTLNNLDVAMRCISTGVNFVHSLSSDGDEVQRLNQLVEKAAQDVKLVEAKKIAMFTEFLPMLEQMTTDLQKESQNVKGLSLVALSVKRWNLKNMLADMKRSLEKFTNGMKVEEEFQLCVDKMDQGLSLMMTLYDHVERYQERKELADYIANINLASGESSKITDLTLKNLIAKMDFSISANLFVDDYKKALAGFKQWVFPFAANYLETNEELSEAEYGNVIKTAETDQKKALVEMVGFYKSKVKNLSTQLKKYYSSTVTGDEDLIVMDFLDGYVAVRPFFVWRNTKWQTSIENLLAGKQVHLKADPILDSETWQMLQGKAAVKYKSVELKLKTIDPDLQGELDEALKPFEMQMTHSGVSLYEVMGQKYVMIDVNQTYRYCFEKEHDKGEKPVCQNEDQTKVQDRADYLMSPYTWWTFQLNDMSPGAGVGFNDLVRKFKGKLDLVLEGDGVYLDVKKKDAEFLKKLDLDQYYERFDGDVDYLEKLEIFKAGRGSGYGTNDQC